MPQPTNAPAPDYFLWSLAHDAANRHGVSPDLVHSLIHVESNYDPNAVSPKGAIGLMQLMPGTAKQLGVDPRDVSQNIDGGVRYLAQLSKQFNGDPDLTLAAYNAGPAAVTAAQGVPPVARPYVDRVKAEMSRTGDQRANPPDFMTWAIQQQATPPSFTTALMADRLGLDRAQPSDNQRSATTNAPQTPVTVSDGASPEEKSLGGFANNVLASGGRLVEGLANTAADLVGTPLIEHKVPHFITALIDHPGAIVDAYKHRYGGWQNIKDTAYNDPVGVAADLAGVLGGASTALSAGSKLARLGELGEVANALVKAGQFASTASDAVNPLSLVTQPVKQFARTTYASALGPTPSLQARAGMSAREFADVGLNNVIGQNKRGLNKIADLQDALMAERNATINRASQAGVSGNGVQLTDDLRDWALNKKGIGIQPTPEAARQAVDDFIGEFMRNAGKKGFLPLDEMEALKEGAYASMPQNHWVQPPTAATRALTDKFSSMLRDAIEQGSTGYENGGRSVANLNAQYGRLESLKDAIGAAGMRAGSRPATMLGETLLGGAFGHPIVGLLGAELLKSPQAAQFLYRAPSLGRSLALQRALSDGQQ